MAEENKSQKIIKATFWYTVSSFLVQGLSFITVPIFTRMLTQAEFGYYNNFISWMGLLEIFATLNLTSALITARFDFEEDIYTFIKSSLLLSWLCTGGIFLLLALGGETVETFLSMPWSYICLMCLLFLCNPAINMFQMLQRYLYKYKVSVALAIFMATATVGLSLLLVLHMENRLAGRLIGISCVPALVGLILCGYYFHHGGKLRVDYWRYALFICLPYIPHKLSLIVLSSTDRVMIMNYCGANDTALYSLAYSCSLAILILQNSLNSAVSPWIGEKIYAHEYAPIRRITAPYALLFALPLIAVELIAPEGVLLMGGEAYRTAIYVMPPVLMGCYFQHVYCLYVNIQQLTKNTKWMAIGSCLAAGLNIVLNMFLIPRFGYIAAAYTTLVCYISLFMFHYVIVRMIGMVQVYDNRQLMVISLILVIVMFLLSFTYEHDILRYSFLVLYILALLAGWMKYSQKIMIVLKGNLK